MYLHPYQIHSVLKTYANKLIQQKEASVREHARIPVEEKRRVVIEKVALDIINKITQIGLRHRKLREVRVGKQHEFGENSEINNQFIYHRIDRDNQKRSCTFSVKNSRELIKDLTMPIIN